jgi:DMSO reductase anchor subunit
MNTANAAVQFQLTEQQAAQATAILLNIAQTMSVSDEQHSAPLTEQQATQVTTDLRLVALIAGWTCFAIDELDRAHPIRMSIVASALANVLFKACAHFTDRAKARDHFNAGVASFLKTVVSMNDQLDKLP